ncbi:hypothetical protein [Streptomyces sp.]|nr:hypothetical protein [Streptomyces sp.]HET6358171.1 hypothetical protein [Streptomyces sp.]
MSRKRLIRSERLTLAGIALAALIGGAARSATEWLLNQLHT